MIAKQHKPIRYELPPDQERCVVIVESKQHPRKRKDVQRRRDAAKKAERETERAENAKDPNRDPSQSSQESET